MIKVCTRIYVIVINIIGIGLVFPPHQLYLDLPFTKHVFSFALECPKKLSSFPGSFGATELKIDRMDKNELALNG